MEYYNDYDYFEAGDTWVLTKNEEFYISDEETKIFEEGTDVEIISIVRDTGYGTAEIHMGGYDFKIGLDELFYMVE